MVVIKGPWDSPAVRNRNIVIYIIPEAQPHDVLMDNSRLQQGQTKAPAIDIL